MTTSDTVLSCENVTLAFGGLRAVDDASLSIQRGTITGLIGPNGAGKSTMVNILSGQLRPQSGRVTFDTADVTGFQAHRIAQRGLIRTFQLSSEFARMTVLENLMVAPRQTGERFWSAVFYRRGWRDQEYELLARAENLLREFGLFSLADEYAGNLSGGQRRLLELARALMAEPRMLLLDEPLAGVAPGRTGQVIDHIVQINQGRSVTVLIVEHSMEVIEQLCSTVLVMIQGQVIAEGSMQQLRENPRVLEAYIS